VCGCVGVWVCGCVGVWVCGCVGVWVCGRVGVRVCGCVGVWVCGCVGVGYLMYVTVPKRSLHFCGSVTVMTSAIIALCQLLRVNFSGAMRVALLLRYLFLN
jgi:hypothetical protein